MPDNRLETDLPQGARTERATALGCFGSQNAQYKWPHNMRMGEK